MHRAARRIQSLAIAATLAILAVGCGPSDASEAVGQAAPDFRLSPLHPSGDVTLASYKGKVVLLDFWATWCGPCRKLMPHLNEFQAKYGPKGFLVLGVTNEDRGTVAGFHEQNPGIGYDIMLDPKTDAAHKYGAKDLPTTVLIGRDGKIKYYEVGFNDDSLKVLEQRIQDAVAPS